MPNRHHHQVAANAQDAPIKHKPQQALAVQLGGPSQRNAKTLAGAKRHIDIGTESQPSAADVLDLPGAAALIARPVR
jgi:hypothetical protein